MTDTTEPVSAEQADSYDPQADSTASYYFAVAEARRRYLLGAPAMSYFEPSQPSARRDRVQARLRREQRSKRRRSAK